MIARSAAIISNAAVLAGAAAGQSSFASRVLDYAPAPGQFVRNPQFNEPSRALGPPSAGGTSAADNAKMVSLGGFGGSITLGFDRRIFNNRHNRFGMDLIVYGNGFWISGDPVRRYAEPGTVEVSRDVNENGLADDAWYLASGSEFAVPLGPRTVVTWDDNTADSTHPPGNSAWVPIGRAGVWTSSAYALGTPFLFPVLVNPGGSGSSVEAYFGLADMSPTAIRGDMDGDNVVDDDSVTAERFYSTPDDPRRVGLSPGAGGGDAIDIGSVLDELTGQPASLPWIDFVRITTASDAINPPLGEMSAEISAVADARPLYSADWNLDGAISVQDIFDYLLDYFTNDPQLEGGGGDFNDSGLTTVQDVFDFLAAYFAG